MMVCLYKESMFTINCLKWLFIVPFGGSQFGDEDINHIVCLEHFDFEISKHFLEVVELIDGVVRIEVSVAGFALHKPFLEVVIIVEVFGLFEEGSSVLYLLNYEIRRNSFKFLHHLELLHQNVTVLLARAHLKVLQHHESHERVQRNPRQQDAEDYQPRQPHDGLLSVPDGRQRSDHYFKAVYEGDILRYDKKAVGIEQYYTEVKEQNVGYALLVEDHFEGEFECEFGLDPVEVSYPSRPWIIVHAGVD